MTQQHIGVGFRDVDKSGDAGRFIHYLDSENANEIVQVFKRFSFDFLHVREGHRILDVGCGTGNDVVALAKMVGERGQIIGVDSSEAMITEARRRVEGLGLAIEFHVGAAHNLEFADTTFDGCRAERTFLHLESPQKALAEMVRVTHPGGHIVVLEPDWETVVIDSPYRDVTRKILNFFCDTVIHNGWIGRQLPRMFKEHGLVDIVGTPVSGIVTDFEQADRLEWRKTANLAHERGLISATDVINWVSYLEKANHRGEFLMASTSFIVCGKKPG